MSSLGRRLHCLERGRRECPECGTSASPADYDVEWCDEPGQEPEEPEFCPACGRQTVFVVTWIDVDPDVPGEGSIVNG